MTISGLHLEGLAPSSPATTPMGFEMGSEIEDWEIAAWKKMKNGLLRIAAQCWIVHETLKH